MLAWLLVWTVLLGVLLGGLALLAVALGGVAAAWRWLRGRA